MDLDQSRWLNQLRLRGEALDVHFDLGLRAYESGDAYALARHRAAVGMLPEAGVNSLAFLALRWRELWLDDAQDEAVSVALRAFEAQPTDVDTAMDLAAILAEVGRDPEALRILLECAQTNPEEPDIWHQVAVLADHEENLELRARAFRHVWELEQPDGPPSRGWVAEDVLVASVERAIVMLPPMVAKALGPLEHVFEDYPEEWILGTALGDPRVVVALEPTDQEEEESHPSARLVFFRWNIERLHVGEEELADHIQWMVRDEVGFALGVEDDALHYEGEG